MGEKKKAEFPTGTNCVSLFFAKTPSSLRRGFMICKSITLHFYVVLLHVWMYASKVIRYALFAPNYIMIKHKLLFQKTCNFPEIKGDKKNLHLFKDKKKRLYSVAFFPQTVNHALKSQYNDVTDNSASARFSFSQTRTQILVEKTFS